MAAFHHILGAFFQALIIAEVILGQSDREVLRELKSFLQAQNPINRGAYDTWSEAEVSPCRLQGVGCDAAGRVSYLDLSSSSIAGPSFGNFSRLNRLTHLDLSANSITGQLHPDLKHCRGLQYLNLSSNLIGGALDVSTLTNLRILDLSQNRFQGDIRTNFPSICRNLSVIAVSSNNLTGRISGLFSGCSKLSDVDLSWNQFTGKAVWKGVERLTRFTATANNLTGVIPSSTFPKGCKLQSLDISSNQLSGSFPNSIANCTSLKTLSLWNNSFGGSIPPGIGSIAGLEELGLSSNQFHHKIPLELMNCTNLKNLEISRNTFGGEVQQVLGKITSLKSLVLQGNNYSGGIVSSGILQLPNLIYLDLSFNKFSGKLPNEIASMTSIESLVLANNNFSGKIPPSYGRLLRLQALDLSYNNLSGEIPPEIGNLASLLLLMLAGNQLSGEIPREIGNCTSLLWLNLVGNQISGKIPPEMTNMGRNPGPTFAKNRRNPSLIKSATSKCFAVYRWVPASYPEFDFVESMMMSQKNCLTMWNRLLMGYDILPVSSPLRTALGYVQLSGNLLSGEIPSTISAMKNISLLLLDGNRLSGHLPSEISSMQLVALNLSNNSFSGQIPFTVGHLNSLESLDLSWNNFSGALPSSLGELSKLSTLNVSYNPLLSGEVPNTGQLSTFNEQSFLGDPLLSFHSPAAPSPHSNDNQPSTYGTEKHPTNEEITVLVVTFLVCFSATFVIRELQSFVYLYHVALRKITNCRNL
ncbi:probable LRR receptor-like serine/threonine-protein kinase At1g74360 [Aegilops tauschii subsp. strangulata]|uniref:Leucine-rich repeat-containing N-terminal plant-type domain-containing protein n=2 Tax=Aegilops tauschii TaxID=37682 RepID=A0A453SRY1_AEGTS|nr:probable LRR receptor-like serine/threonine-protein kinase At1g74360 [Aegilops tauschii subsp. strangulata]